MLSTANPSAGSASTSSPLVCAVACRLPNTPACAAPTFSTTPTEGGAIAHRSRMLPGARAPISSTRNRVCTPQRSAVSGTPSSLLYDPVAATVSPSGASSAAIRSLVLVLPDDPVTATTRRPDAVSRSVTARASRASPASTSSTSTDGQPTGRATSAATAPAAAAETAKSCPSTRSPGSAANREPGPACRESATTGPDTTARGDARRRSTGHR